MTIKQLPSKLITSPVTIIGAGLAGSEAAWTLAIRGIDVRLYEMRPAVMTPAHTTGLLAELVCSNSLGSHLVDRATGLLQEELRLAGSLIMACAAEARVPAGGALAVDRTAFAEAVTAKISAHPRIHLVREEVKTIPTGPVIIASGPLTSPDLATVLAERAGQSNLYFYDAVAPLVEYDSIDQTLAFRASRYGRGESVDGDYLNCPLNKEEYEAFVAALLAAERLPLPEFEKEITAGVNAGHYFEGCLPVEVLAGRSSEALAYGPMRPVGLTDPRTGRRPYAVVQLRQDNLAATLYNLVGFQTNLRYGEQQRVLRMIPGLGRAEFARYGHMHRNTFLAAPRLLRPTLQWHDRDDLFCAGQICGIEGYVGNVASGLIAGRNAAALLQGEDLKVAPLTTMTGALINYITHAELGSFQPMKANFGILPPLAERHAGKRDRYSAYSERALADWREFWG